MRIQQIRQDTNVPPQDTPIDGTLPPDTTTAWDGEVTTAETAPENISDTLTSTSPETSSTAPLPAETTSSNTQLSTTLSDTSDVSTPPSTPPTMSTTEIVMTTTASSTPTPTPSTPSTLRLTSTSVTTFTTPTSTELPNQLSTTTTVVNGQTTTFVSPNPTTLVEADNANSGGSSRTGLIAGLTSGLIMLLILLLGAAFILRRRRRQREGIARTIESKRREGRGLLDGEGFYDDHEELPSMRSLPLTSPQPRSLSPILRTRASETGSIFRENVWPPPATDLVDPVIQRSSTIDLTRVVDEVMGPFDHSRRSGTDTSMDSSTPLMSNPFGSTHSRGPSLNSQYQDYGSQSLPSLRASVASYPSFSFASSGSIPHEGLTPIVAMGTAVTTSPTSLQPPSPLQGISPDFSPSPSTSPPGTQSALPPTRGNAVPKTSSPLARRLSQDAKIWLTRNPAPPGKSRTTS